MICWQSRKNVKRNNILTRMLPNSYVSTLLDLLINVGLIDKDWFVESAFHNHLLTILVVHIHGPQHSFPPPLPGSSVSFISVMDRLAHPGNGKPFTTKNVLSWNYSLYSKPGWESLYSCSHWQHLTNLIGENCISLLFTRYSLFSTHGSNLVQLAGTPIMELYKPSSPFRKAAKRKYNKFVKPILNLSKPKSISINHRFILFNNKHSQPRSSSKFQISSRFILDRLSPSTSHARVLLLAVLGKIDWYRMNTKSRNHPRIRLNKRQQSYVPIFKRILQRYHDTDINSLFGNILYSYKMSIDSPGNTQDCIHIPITVVFTFLRRLSDLIFPVELWGSAYNKRQLKRNISVFLKTKRYESITLYDMIQNIRFGDMTWLCKHITVGHSLLLWFFNEFLIPVLNRFIYCTDSEIYKRRILYYSKYEWNRMMEQFMNNNSQFSKVADMNNLLKCNLVVPSRLRLSPKSNHQFRNIINMSQSCLLINGKRRRVDGMNSILFGLFNVLTYEIEKSFSSTLGASINGISPTTVHQRISSFLLTHKCRKIFCVKMDLKNCFDNIDRDLLYRIIERNILKCPQYRLDQYVCIKECRNGVYRYSRITKCDDKSGIDVFNKEKGLIIFGYDPSKSYVVKCQQLLEILHNHLTKNIIQIGHSQYYIQTKGIPQGSILSTLLCNIYLGHLENEHISPIFEEDRTLATTSLLSRYTDDYLLFTTIRKHALGFVNVLYTTGREHFNIEINELKSSCSFVFYNSSISTETLIDWCGIRIDTETYQVYSTVSTNMNQLSYSYSTFKGYNPGIKLLTGKCIYFLSFNVKMILLDPLLNTPATVVYNIHQIFTVSCWRFILYYNEICACSYSFNPDFVIQALEEMVSHFYNLARKLFNQSRRIFSCSFCQIKSIAFKSYIQVLSNCSSSRYAEVLRFLYKQGRLYSLQSIPNTRSSQLNNGF